MRSMSAEARCSAPHDRTSCKGTRQCIATTLLRDPRTCQDGFGCSRDDAASSLVRRLNVLLDGVVKKFEQRLDDLFNEHEQRQTPRSHAPASGPIAMRRRRPRSALRPRSSGLASIPTPARLSAAHAREAPPDLPRLTLVVGDDEPPPSTERSDPPTQPSPSIRSLPSPLAARAPAVEVVESKRDEAPPNAGRGGDAVPPPSATRGTRAVADPIETLTQRGYSIRVEGKE